MSGIWGALKLIDKQKRFPAFDASLIKSDGEENVDADYELIFSESENNTLLEFKKLSNTNVTVDQLVDEINESLSW